MATETSAPGQPTGQDPDPILADIGVALFHLRRVWAKPDLMKRIRAQTSDGLGGRPLQISNLMVVNAVAALTAGSPANPGSADEHDIGDAREPSGTISCEVSVGAVAE